MTLKKNLIFLSPHLDDFALSCADFALSKIQSDHSVQVVTIFTNFQSNNLPQYSQQYVENCHSETIQEFKSKRKSEDRQAMRILGISKYKHLDFTDGGFRLFENNPIYPSKKDLFSGKIAKEDSELITKLNKKLLHFISPNSHYFCPFGIGNHADHLIVRKVAESIVPPPHLFYYLDFPYTLLLKNWNFSLVQDVFLKKKGKLLFRQSLLKRACLSAYSSQIPLLFGTNTVKYYPEYIFSI